MSVSKNLLVWLTPILAAVTFLLDGGHMVGLIKPEVLVLIAAATTALVGFFAAIKQSEEQQAPNVQQLPHPQAAQQPPQPQKK